MLSILNKRYYLKKSSFLTLASVCVILSRQHEMYGREQFTVKRNNVLVYVLILTIICCGTTFAQPNPGPGEKNLSPGPGNEKVFANDEATPPGKDNDSDNTGPKSSVKKEALKKAGAVAAGGVAAKKTKDIVADKIKE